MCGVVGAILRDQPVLEGIIEGLRVLEYRGYDSAGVAVLDWARCQRLRYAIDAGVRILIIALFACVFYRKHGSPTSYFGDRHSRGPRGYPARQN